MLSSSFASPHSTLTFDGGAKEARAIQTTCIRKDDRHTDYVVRQPFEGLVDDDNGERDEHDSEPLFAIQRDDDEQAL